MRSCLLLVPAVVVLGLSSGCISWDIQQRSHSVKIVTDPPGATVWQTDSSGNRRIGSGPTEVKKEYQVKVGKPTPACWIGTAVVAGLSAWAGYVAATHKPDESSTSTSSWDSTRTLSLTGAITGGTMALSMIPLCAGLDSMAKNEIAMQGSEVIKLSASADGYKDQELTVMMPGPQKEVHLTLRPGSSNILAGRSGGIGLVSASDSGPRGGVVGGSVGSGPSYISGAPQPASYALIVGVERYRDVPSPTGARSDAEQFARVVRSTLGVPEANIRIALDDRATRSDIEKQIEWLQGNVQAGGRIYFYFSGHGAPDASAGTPYLLPYDGDPKFLTRTALPLSSVLKSLGETRARDVLAVVDTCFSGAGGRSVLPDGARPLVRVKEAPVAARLALMTASSGAEISGSVPGGAGGLFTRYLNEGLGKGQADINGDGQISLQELSEWVRPRVARDAKRDNRDQTPAVQVGSGLQGGAGSFIIAQGIAGTH